jgi:AraC family transcriptional regulator, transcriptional activator of pobA
MKKTTTVPIWELPEMGDVHFGKEHNFVIQSTAHDLFHINKLEDFRDKIHFPLPPHRKPVYDFLFVTRGATHRSKSLNPYTIEENTFFFLPAYQITEHEFMSEDIEGYFCHFNFKIFNTHLPQHNIVRDFAFLQFISDPVITIDETTKPFVINILQRLELEYKKEKDCDFNIIAAYLFALFTEINRFYTPSVLSHNNSALINTQRFKDALARHIYEKQKLTEYAELLNITPNHLNKCTKAATGRLAQDLLHEMILLEARVLLRQTDMPISEIAYKLTKQDHSSFTRFFKQHTGVKPIDYRNNP